MSNAQNALPSGTILKETYHILVDIGEGGFSITYLAEDLTDGKIVVIKELYNSEYMDRSASEESVFIRDIFYMDRFKKDRERFHNEWNMMETFRSYPGMIQPIDFFEANNTLYIAMEYLSGKTLEDAILSDGPFRTDNFIEKISDVLNLVAAIHQKGYIHGDISPDNLVLDSNGNFRLIDFGAVQKIGTVTMKTQHIYKKGYTPPEAGEQYYNTDQKWDIYSLCAVFYFALTGTAPEDSFERTLDDDLKTPVKLIPDTDRDISDMVMKGLSMIPEDRWQTVSDIQTQLNSFLERKAAKAAETKSQIKRRRVRRIFFSFSVAIIALTLAIIFCQTQKEFVKFIGQKTQKIAVYYDKNITQKDYQTLCNNLSQKAEHIAGKDRYLLSESDGIVEIIVPDKLFENIDCSSVINKYFNYSSCTLYGYDDNNIKTGSVQLNSENIISASEENGSCIISLSEALSSSIAAKADKSNSYVLQTEYYDSGTSIWNERYILESDYRMKATFSRSTGQIIINSDEFETDFAPELLIDCLTQETIPIKKIDYSRHIVWEKKQKTTWGKYQVEPSQMRTETILLSYVDDNFSDYHKNILDYTIYDKEIENDDSIILLKKRLDALQVPYACGWEKNHENIIYVAVSSKDIWEIEAVLLFSNLSVDSFSRKMDIKSESGILLPDIDTDTPFRSDKEGHIYVTVDDPDVLKVSLSRIKEKGDDNVQLCLDNRPVLQTTLSNVNENGVILFNTSLLSNIKTDKCSQNNEQFVDFINTLLSNHIYNYYTFADALFTDYLEIPLWDRSLPDMYGCEPSALRTKINDYYSDKSFSIDWHDSSAQITCTYDDQMQKQYKHPFALAAEFLQKFKWTNELQNIAFNVSVPGTVRSKYYLSTSYNMSISPNTYYGLPEAKWDITYRADDIYANDYYGAQVPSDKELVMRATQYLSSENVFSNCYLNPALHTRYEKTIADTENLSLKLYCKDTLPGQDYQFTFWADNKSSEAMEMKIEQMVVNGTTLDLATDSFRFGPQESSDFNLSFSEDDLHFPTTEPFESIKATLSINYGDQEIQKQVEITASNDKDEDE